MKLGAIDVGTNSIHTVIVEVDADLNIVILDSAKETVHLGRGRDREGNLSPRAIVAGLTALRKAKTLCERHGVEEILAVATSAIREAPNGLEFLRHVQEEVGITVRVISGKEEARLIYLAVRESLHLGDRPFLAIDVGGGSVEFSWATRERLFHSESLKLGVLRLAEEYPLSDPPTKEELKRLKSYIHSQLDLLEAPAAQYPWQITVGTSGTLHQLCRLAVGETVLLTSNSLHQEEVPADSLRKVCDRLIASTVQERMAIKDLDRTRIHTIVPGAVLLRELLDRFPIGGLVVCEYALREGVIYDYVARNRSGILQAAVIPDVRMRSVLALARRCNWDETHSRHVTRLSLQMFDQLAPRFQWDPGERDLLEFAGLLHDIGKLINVRRHHRHGQYLIENADLLGFTPREVALVANLVRYHREAKPKKKHEAYGALKKSDRKIVDRLAGILRLAEAFDRTSFQMIEAIHVDVEEETVHLTALARGDVEVELSLARERKDLLERALKRPIEIHLGDASLIASPEREALDERLSDDLSSLDATPS
ncbi:MAG: phosphatase [Candidatus Poribacteria bacterium]|nr:MAG: phosphatase [Candidatus Poribacteria bacterium]